MGALGASFPQMHSALANIMVFKKHDKGNTSLTFTERKLAEKEGLYPFHLNVLSHLPKHHCPLRFC